MLLVTGIIVGEMTEETPRNTNRSEKLTPGLERLLCRTMQLYSCSYDFESFGLENLVVLEILEHK